MFVVASVCRNARLSSAMHRVFVQTARLSTSASRLAFKEFSMPAMSPTMEHGNLGQWKVKEGDTFAAGDVILEVETDKAMMDVAAPDDGLMARILKPSGSKDIPVNEVIAILADEGDDISQAPGAEDVNKGKSGTSTSSSSPSPSSSSSASQPTESHKRESPSETASHAQRNTHVHVTKPTFPSVLRLAHERGISDPESKISGTGRHGMITKGDILAYVGETGSAFGTASPHHTTISELGDGKTRESGEKLTNQASPPKQLRVDEQRSMIISGLAAMAAASRKTTKETKQTRRIEFADIVQQYVPRKDMDTATHDKKNRAGSSASTSLQTIYEQLWK